MFKWAQRISTGTDVLTSEYRYFGQLNDLHSDGGKTLPSEGSRPLIYTTIPLARQQLQEAGDRVGHEQYA